MKGIYIYEVESRIGTVVDCLELGDIYNIFTHEIASGTITEEVKMHALVSKGTKSKCSKDDTYDFETGALIALMKMCGRDKVIKACDELYKDDNYKNALQEMTENNEKLIEENERLKKEYDELFESDKYSKSLVGRLSFEKHRLEEENEKLKLDCEKLQHGYIGTDMIFCGGRQNGKQFTFLVDLFKKLDKKKVQEAYKEAYGDRVIWCTSQPLSRDLLDSLIEGSKYAIPYVVKWVYKLPTKREEMWAKIFELHNKSDVNIKVKKEDVNTFLHELENKIPEITWASCVKIFETKYTIGDIYKELKTYDFIYFRLWKENKLSYTSDSHIYPYRELKEIPYLPPMRWDLFKKGRLAVKVTYRNYKEFYEACEKELGKKPSTYFSSDYTVSICKKDGCFEVFTVEHQKKTGRKIVNWEDVR